MATVRMTTQINANATSNGAANLTHVDHSTFANARPPMMAAHVGVNMFTKPLPALNTMIMASTENPRCWARGAMMGMDTVAIPDDDGTRKDNTTYSKNDSGANTTADNPSSA